MSSTELGVIEPIMESDWATPIVCVLKSDGTLRIAGDYRSTVNKFLRSDPYPLPTLQEAFAKLAGGAYFTKLDLKMAYNQVLVSDETARLLTMATHKGLYKMKRMPYGVSRDPPIFQRIIDKLVANLPGVIVLLDDILVSSSTRSELHEREKLVLERLSDAGFRLKASKGAIPGSHNFGSGTGAAKRPGRGPVEGSTPANSGATSIFFGQTGVL